MGAVVPILVLSYLTDPLGAVPAYVVSALVPVGWVLVDLFFVTRRFNFITGFLGLRNCLVNRDGFHYGVPRVGKTGREAPSSPICATKNARSRPVRLFPKQSLSAIVRGLLAFWFVDGPLYALKDSVGGILTALVFGGSLVVGRPLVGAFAAQGLDPRTREQENSLDHLFAERPVARTLRLSTAILAMLNAATGFANFLLNLWIVTAPFGTGEFNSQVARVNAITRLALGVPEFLAVGFAIWWVIYAMHSRLYSQMTNGTGERDFWALVEMREERARHQEDSP